MSESEDKTVSCCTILVWVNSFTAISCLCTPIMWSSTVHCLTHVTDRMIWYDMLSLLLLPLDRGKAFCSRFRHQPFRFSKSVLRKFYLLASSRHSNTFYILYCRFFSFLGFTCFLLCVLVIVVLCIVVLRLLNFRHVHLNRFTLHSIIQVHIIKA